MRAASSRVVAIFRSSSSSSSSTSSGTRPWTISSMALASLSARSRSSIVLAGLGLPLHALPQLAQGAENGNPHVHFAGVQDVRDLAIRELRVELQGDDLLLAGRQLAQERGQVVEPLLVQERVLGAGRLVDQLVVPGGVLERLGGRLLLPPVGSHL